VIKTHSAVCEVYTEYEEPGYNFPEYLEILKKAVSEIDDLTKGTENDFLLIGEQLAGYLYGTKELKEASSFASDSISKRILQDGIAPLSSLMKEFSGYLAGSSAEINNDIESLHEIHDNVIKIIDEQNGFSKIVKSLKMLGISTKIESVRLGADDQGFYALAENVDKLSNLISDKSKIITEKSARIISVITSAAQVFKGLAAKQQQHSGSILQYTTDTISDLEKSYSHCSGKVTQISESSEEVSRSIKELVTSIQFHDITRQQMEHVKEVFIEQAVLIEAALSRCSAEEENNAMETLVYSCELQNAQLNSSAGQFCRASGEILSNLVIIEDNVGKIFTESCALFDKNDASQGSPLGAIQTELTLISENLKENTRIGDSLSNSILNVIEVLDELGAHIMEIESIGDEIEIIALNSRVKAARSGSNGSALGVLSEAIQRLSIQAKIQSESTAVILDNITHSSENLRKSIQSIAGAERKKQIAGLDSRIFSLIDSTLSIEKETQAIIEKMRGMVLKLKSQINSTINGFTISSSVKKRTENIIEDISRIIAGYKRNGFEGKSREEKTKKYLSKYTMHSERDIHKTFASEGISAKPERSSEGFDSNIELF